MSYFEAQAPECQTKTCPKDVDMVLIPRTVDLGGFDVRRVLPARERRMVGPFVFWDQFGRSEFLTGTGIDVRPHPHIGIATLTYLFEGSILHRDNLGSAQVITPGDVNLMVAGSGIAHSERTGQDVRKHPHTLFGLQIWLALPGDKQEIDPSFHHHTVDSLPIVEADGITMRIVTGKFHGVKSAVNTVSDNVFVDVQMQPGSTLSFPAEAEERAIHIVSGNITVGKQSYQDAHMLILQPGHPITIRADDSARVILLGGAALDGPRHLWWNFVSTSKERIEQAKQDWLNGRFAKIPGDEEEFIPLPK